MAIEIDVQIAVKVIYVYVRARPQLGYTAVLMVVTERAEWKRDAHDFLCTSTQSNVVALVAP